MYAFIFSSILCSHAQGLNFINKALDVDVALRMSVEGGTPIDLEKVDGSPYLNDDFLHGYTRNSTTGEELKAGMRYNIFNDQIEVLNPSDNSLGGLNQDQNYICTIGNKTFRYLENGLNSTMKPGYYEVLVSEDIKISLLAKYESRYIAERPPATPLQKGRKARFKTKINYFIKKNGNFVELPKKRKKLLEFFSDKKSEIKTYAKKNNFNLKNTRDFIRIITYYNSL